MKNIIFSILCIIFFLNSAYAINDLLPLQGVAYNSSGDRISSGNITIIIYDALTSGNIVYNSSTDFHNSIVNGQYNIFLGSGSVELLLEFSEIYYLDMFINDENIDFSGSDRQIFQSPVGDIKKIHDNATSIGDFSIATGFNSNVSGSYSLAFGFNSKVLANFSSAFGYDSEISGDYSYALGYNSDVSGDYSFGFGYDSEVNGDFSYALGYNSIVEGFESYALGRNSNVSGYQSYGFGSNSRVSSNYSYGFGDNLIVNKNEVFAISLNSSYQTFNQSNTFSVMGGNSGFGVVDPKRTIHISDTLRLEPISGSQPDLPKLGDLYVDSDTNELCFFNGTGWEGVTGNICD